MKELCPNQGVYSTTRLALHPDGTPMISIGPAVDLSEGSPALDRSSSMSEQLSPAAQSVWNAAWQLSPVNCESHEDRRRQQIAAALRVAAAHLPNSAMYPSSDWGRGWRTGINDARQGLIAIAAELDGTHPRSENV